MPILIDGLWNEELDYLSGDDEGRFQRSESRFRDRIEAGGRFAPEPGRYHLYVSWACPWAHRTLIYRKLKGLEPLIGLSVVDPLMGSHSWHFSDAPGCIPDHVNGCDWLWQLYLKADPHFTGVPTVPLLWDRREETVVNNESSEIIRLFNSAFDGCGGDPEIDFYPEPLRDEIDRLNELTYEPINNGVYKAGFATTQTAYEEAFDTLFDSLDRLEALLGQRRYLAGDRISEADWRLFPTLIRFDAVYHGHFKCNLHRLADYPNLSGYTRELYQHPGVRETVNFDHIKRHYYGSHRHLNPSGVVPKGPLLDFDQAHSRSGLQSAP